MACGCTPPHHTSFENELRRRAAVASQHCNLTTKPNEWDLMVLSTSIYVRTQVCIYRIYISYVIYMKYVEGNAEHVKTNLTIFSKNGITITILIAIYTYALC